MKNYLSWFSLFSKFLLLIFILVPLLFADNIISGYVENKQNQQLLKNVNIIIEGTNFGTTTDINGYFNLDVKGFPTNQKILFSYMGYKNLLISISDLKKLKRISLTPTNIIFDNIDVEGKKKKIEYTQEITNNITILTQDEFSSGGYLDVADLIATENSLMVDENLSGKKTISVRGANSDETMILYDGIKINSGFDNIFDLSLLNPATLAQIDIIKGGSLATFGGVGASAVLNFIPKLDQEYFIKFHQRFGSYNSGDWGINLFKQIADLKLFLSTNEGASSLNYVDDENGTIDRTSNNITINTKYDFNIAQTENAIKANYIKSNRGYLNNAYSDSLDMSQDLITIKYQGNYFSKGKLSIAFSTNDESEKHRYNVSNLQDVTNNNLQFQSEYSIPINSANFFLGLKRENIESELKEKFSEVNIQNSDLLRFSNEISTGFKVENSNSTNKFDMQSLSFNYNYKSISDEGDSSFAINSKFKHQKSSILISSIFSGESNVLFFTSHVNYSSDFRLPTPYQQLLSQHYHSELQINQPMLMEYKKNIELGFEISNKSKITNYLVSALIFKTSYENKFRQIQLSGSPIVFLDNYKDADITGVEGQIEAGFINEKIRLGVNYNRYMIEDKTAFPFKAESKLSTSLSMRFKNISLKTIWFKESERTGIVYSPTDGLTDIVLDKFDNIDIHLETSVQLWRTKILCAFSGRNLLGGELIKEGIAIRDKRYYLTFGFEVK